LSFFVAFLGGSQRWEFKNTTKNVLQKKTCRKAFTKKSTENPKPIFLYFLYHVFGRPSVRGTPPRYKKPKKDKTRIFFWPLAHQPRGYRFFSGRPIAAMPAGCWVGCRSALLVPKAEGALRFLGWCF
jgi:hypothetical protein